MSTIGFIVLPEKGHINPYIGPAQALGERNHKVLFASAGDISKQITAAGLYFDRSLVSTTAPTVPMNGEALVELIQNPIQMRGWIRTLLLSFSKEDVDRHIHWIRSSHLDVLVVDPLAYPAVIAAELTNTKWVSMSNSLNPILDDEVKSDLLTTVQELTSDRQKLFQRHGVNLNFKGCDALSKYLTIAFCTKELVGDRATATSMVGPSSSLNHRGDECPIQDIDKVPNIYLSFGSQLSYWPELFQHVITATEGLPYRLIISAGELANKIQAPAHVSLYGYAPQAAILKNTKLFISHGGANSVMEALAANVPMWISPMCNDQFHQAHYINKAGAGWCEDIKKLTPREIRARINALINNRQIQERLTPISRSYQRDGSRESARLIEELL